MWLPIRKCVIYTTNKGKTVFLITLGPAFSSLSTLIIKIYKRQTEPFPLTWYFILLAMLLLSMSCIVCWVKREYPLNWREGEKPRNRERMVPSHIMDNELTAILQSSHHPHRIIRSMSTGNFQQVIIIQKKKIFLIKPKHSNNLLSLWSHCIIPWGPVYIGILLHFKFKNKV